MSHTILFIYLKNYFTTMFSIFSKINDIQTHHKTSAISTRRLIGLEFEFEFEFKAAFGWV